MVARFDRDAPATIVFSLFYAVFCTGKDSLQVSRQELIFLPISGFIYQSKEFTGAGLSPEVFLSYNDWIGSEELRFFVYHMKRTAGSMVIHSVLPAGMLADLPEYVSY